MSDTNSNAIIPVEPPDADLLAITMSPMRRLVRQVGILWTNVPLASAEAQAMLEAIVGVPTIEGKHRLDTPMRLIAAMVCEPRGHDPQTGEVYTSPTTTLLLEDGSTLRWASPGVADSLSVMTMLRPAGRFTPPIEFVCVEVPCKNGHDRVILRAAPSPIDPRPVKGAKRG